MSFLAQVCYDAVMRDETLEDLLRPILEKGELTAWAKKHDIRPMTLLRARRGWSIPTTGTLTLLAIALKLPVERVRLAAQRSLEARSL